MRQLATAIGISSLLIWGSALAHAHLETAAPADGSVVTSPPATLALTFSQTVRLTALWIQQDDEPKRPVPSLPMTKAPTVTVGLPALTPGVYTVTWRLLGKDGHIASGELHFTIAAPNTKDRR